MSWNAIGLVLAVLAGVTPVAELAGGGGPVDVARSRQAEGWDPPRDVLYDNGPFVNSPGTGVGGADESVAQDVTLYMVTLGYANGVIGNNWLADDFVFPAGGWWLQAVTFYAYEPNAPTSPSTFTEVRFAILDSSPNTASPNIVYGDYTTNRLSSSVWTGCYRVKESTSGTSSQRPIMANRCELSTPVSLVPGPYWIVWLSGGPSGAVYAPPISISGQVTTGNGLQFVGSGWAETRESGTYAWQGFPFVLEGMPTSVEPTTWGSVKALFR